VNTSFHNDIEEIIDKANQRSLVTEQVVDLSHDQLAVKLDEKKFEIPFKKRINILEPDPEEEINDSS
jgi:hypothetical protein